jgi:xylulokinase
MPAVPKTGQALFLGLELATDQLRASIVDESLELVGVECVDFDTELSEYQCVPFSFFFFDCST